MSTQAPIGFKLRRVVTEKFKMTKEAFAEGEKVKLRRTLAFEIDSQNRLVACIAEFQFLQKEQAFIDVSASCNFEIDNESWENQIHDNSLVLPKGFLSHLAALTIGTLRGILHTKTEQTQFNKFFIPTTNVTDLIKDDIVHQLPSSDNIEVNSSE